MTDQSPGGRPFKRGTTAGEAQEVDMIYKDERGNEAVMPKVREVNLSVIEAMQQRCREQGHVWGVWSRAMNREIPPSAEHYHKEHFLNSLFRRCKWCKEEHSI